MTAREAETNGRVKLTPGDAIKVGLLIFGIGAAWTTQLLGNASNAARIERVERKIDRLDSLTVAAQFQQVTRYEFQRAQFDAAQARKDLDDLDARVREVEIEVTKPGFTRRD